MRVLHLISSGGLYGAEAVILQLSEVLNRDTPGSSHIAVFSHAGQSIPGLYSVAQSAGVPVHLVPCKGQLDPGVGGALRKLLADTGSNVLHCHGYKADIYGYWAFHGRVRPALVSTCHTWYDNDWAVRLYGAADRRVLRRFDAVVAVSTAVERRLLAAGVSPSSVTLVPNGVSLPEVGATQPVYAGSAKVEMRIGLVGRLAPEKGVDLFLQAAAALLPRFPHVRFVVAGEGPERSSLEGQHRQLQLGDRVQLLGAQADMPSFYGSLDLLVSASRQEGLPMALLEGMAAGLPVVATAVGEVPRVVVPGETGLLVAPGDAHALAEAIDQVIETEDMRARFGSAGRRRVEQHFSAARMTASYQEVYGKALRRHACAAGASRPGEAR